MGQAKQRGSLEQRIAQAQAKIEATRPAKLICNSCQGDVTDIHPVSTRGLRGIEAIWMGNCQCGHITYGASGEPKAIQALFEVLSTNSEMLLGLQGKDGEGHSSM